MHAFVCVCWGCSIKNTCIVSIKIKYFKKMVLFFSSYHSFFHSNKIL